MDGSQKKALTETDIRTKFITPAIVGDTGAGWDLKLRCWQGANVRS
ncbi:MAG: hypothetical protein CALGDGBN_03292 [Pseudomonadales bacterium]|nr:hypothetical protein [Pseudomonadales bacterium]